MHKECVQCKEIKEESLFPKSFGDNRKNRCKACYGRRERAKLKLDMLNALGWVCYCCGEDHPLMLTLDHVKNDGHTYREQYNEQQIYRLARKSGWPKDEYQVLCMNCNFAKGHFGECPHKMGLSKEESTSIIKATATGDGTRFRRWYRKPE